MPTLIIYDWYSVCQECGHGAEPYEQTHRTVLPFPKACDHPGCGARFTDIGTGMWPTRMVHEAVAAMRPDLNYIGHVGLDKPEERV